MQPLPANGQAQTLPANNQPYEIGKKYRIVWKDDFNDIQKEDAVYRDGFKGFGFYFEDGGRLTNDAELLSVQAMAEGYYPDSGQPSDAEIERKHNLVSAHKYLTWAGEHEAAAALKAKHPEIWPVDYAAIVVEKAVAWVKLPTSEREGELSDAVRNYLNNQK